jgi:DNA-binding SARP family transcriptional activator
LFRIELLGGFQFSMGSARLELQMPARRLLAALALHEKPLQRSYVAGMLWPNVSEDRAAGNVRSTIFRLGPARDVVDGRALLALHRDAWVDVEEVLQTARQVIAEEPTLPVDVLDTLASPGELLPDWYDDWLVFERERFNEVRLLALDALGRRLLRRRRIAEATVAALAAATTDPFRESSQQLLIDCHIAQGNRGAALRQFRTYASMLKDELGLEPPSTITAVVAALAATNA